MAKIPEHYKLIKEHAKSYEVHDGRDKTSFHIAKKDLEDHQHRRLKKLPKYAEGGEVTDIERAVDDATSGASAILPQRPDAATIQRRDAYNREASLNTPFNPALFGMPADDPTATMFGPGGEAPKEFDSGAWQKADRDVQAGIGMKQAEQSSIAARAAEENEVRAKAGLPPLPGTPQLSPAAPAQQVPQAGVPVQAPQGVPTAAPGAESTLSQINSNTAMQVAGIQGVAQAKQQEAKDTQQLLYDGQERVNQLQQDAEANMWKRNIELDRIAEESAQEIDPHRYVNSLSLGNKILGAIAMGIGGGGAATAKQQNLAFETIQNAIKQDVEAQKSNINNKQTLYAKMLQRYGDAHRAEQETIAHVSAAVQGQIAAVAAKSAGAQAMPNAQYLQGALKNDTLIKTADLVKREADEKLIRAAMETNNPAIIQALPAEARERWVSGYGPASSKEAAKEANNKIAAVGGIVDGIKELKTLADKGSSLSIQDRARAQTIAAMLKGQLRTEIVGPGAVSESEWKLLDAIVANPTNFTQLSSTAKTSLGAVEERIQNNMNRSLTQFGIQPKAQERTSEYATKDGVKYKKVPGGWKMVQ